MCGWPSAILVLKERELKKKIERNKSPVGGSSSSSSGADKGKRPFENVCVDCWKAANFKTFIGSLSLNTGDTFSPLCAKI